MLGVSQASVKYTFSVDHFLTDFLVSFSSMCSGKGNGWVAVGRKVLALLKAGAAASSSGLASLPSWASHTCITDPQGGKSGHCLTGYPESSRVWPSETEALFQLHPTRSTGGSAGHPPPAAVPQGHSILPGWGDRDTTIAKLPAPAERLEQVTRFTLHCQTLAG